MKHRLLSQLTIALALVAIAAPLAHATGPYDGYKSTTRSCTSSARAPVGYDGYKSSYPQLHQLRSGVSVGYDGYKSSYPQLHVVLSHQVVVPTAQAGDHGFVWRDAAVGAGTAAFAILLIAGAALFLSRRRVKLAV